MFSRSKRGELISNDDLLDTQKTLIKNFEVWFQTKDFSAIELQFMSEGQKFNFFPKKCPIVVSVVLTAAFS